MGLPSGREINNPLTSILSREGFEVDIAVNGKVAQGILEKEQYDICLIDIRIPLMDGIELYQWLQEKHPKSASRVVFTLTNI